MAYGAILGKETPEVTLESIGAAPAGYGLGKIGGKVLTAEDNLDDILEMGFYSWTGSAPQNADFGYRCMVVYSMRETEITQVVYPMDFTGNPRLWRHFDGSTWSTWETVGYFYGTDDLTAGSSSLATGALYFVYE